MALPPITGLCLAAAVARNGKCELGQFLDELQRDAAA
jgi:hypothetical protein